MAGDSINSAKQRIAQFSDLLGVAERYITAILMIVMTALYAFNVLVRLFVPTHASVFAWIDEAARYMMIWVVFLAAGLTLEVGRHVSVDLIRPFLSTKTRNILFGVIDVIGFVFSFGASIYAFNLASFVASTGQMSPTLGVPTFILYVAPCLGFGLMAFRFLLRLTHVRDARKAPVAADWLGGMPS
jgi:TRAP-type C4-dicarboxylate transport system permease small subunit